MDNKYSCGESECTLVKHTRVDRRDSHMNETEIYNVEDFTGTGLNKLLKQAKIIPFYEDEYSIEEEVFTEYDVER